jgi:hypothetical protein
VDCGLDCVRDAREGEVFRHKGRRDHTAGIAAASTQRRSQRERILQEAHGALIETKVYDLAAPITCAATTADSTPDGRATASSRVRESGPSHGKPE